MNTNLKLLQLTKARHEPTVVELFSKLTLARNKFSKEEKAKDRARIELRKSMKTTLDKYQISINRLLKKFGASFTIENMETNFRGNAPRSDYMLSLRGKNITVDGNSPSFATALSDGDKRTMAFAFFIATTLEDSGLSKRVVVIDDPMCSLDMNRKHNTQNVLCDLCFKTEQLIILAHDKYFIHGLKTILRKKDKDLKIKEIKLTASTNNYTNFAVLNLEKECESLYFQHHRLLRDFIDGSSTDINGVSKTIRPLLEGYLHRRFPGALSKNSLFGCIVGDIKSSSCPSPLVYAKSLVEELNEINAYAGKFHHDNDDNTYDEIPLESELRNFVERTLSIIHKGVL